jgi:pimeloyl-ACP methyl ester carboxylesterase
VLVLVHGFGSSKDHYRRLVTPEAFPNLDVYAIDLLGFGESEKPTSVAYNMRLYRDQIKHFLETRLPEGAHVHLCGNSIGSLASLMVGASGDTDLKSLILLNCAGGLNNKAVSRDWRIKLALPLFWLIDAILLSGIGPKIFDRVRSKENLRQVLTNLYPSNPEAVDDELISLFYEPSQDPNAFHVFREIFTTEDSGPYPPDIVEHVDCPILLLWGDCDTLTPSDGPVGKFFRSLASTRANATFVDISGAGHVFFDEQPDVTIEKIQSWVDSCV